MDVDLFLNTVKTKCELRNTSPTVACVQSGLSRSFLTDIKKGRSPTVGNLEKLAAYLGCTVSELLGEFSIVGGETNELLIRFSQLNDEGRERLLETADDMVRSGKYSKKSSQPGLGSKEA